MPSSVRDLLLFPPIGRVLPFSDAFNRANGVAGDPWEAGVWAIAAGGLGSTPTLGGEKIANGTMEAGDPPTNWDASNATLSSAADERTGGAGAASLDVVNTGAVQGNGQQQIANSLGDWIHVTGWGKNITGAIIARLELQTSGWGGIAHADVAGGTWQAVSFVGRATTTNCRIICSVWSTTIGHNCRFDDMSAKPLTLAELLNVWDFGIQDVVVGAKATLSAGTQCGVALCWDVAKTSGVIAFHDGINCTLAKCVAGAWSDVISAVTAYGAADIVEVERVGTAFTLTYNGVQVGVPTAISDAEIVDNTYGGMFNTYSGNTIDDFYVRAS